MAKRADIVGCIRRLDKQHPLMPARYLAQMASLELNRVVTKERVIAVRYEVVA